MTDSSSPSDDVNQPMCSHNSTRRVSSADGDSRSSPVLGCRGKSGERGGATTYVDFPVPVHTTFLRTIQKATYPYTLVQPEKTRHRSSSYHHDSRHDGRGDKFYSLHDPPPLETISQCISGFIRGTSTLLYVLPEFEAMELINGIYHPGVGRNRPTISRLCELLAIAAIGSQYEDVGQESQMALFRTAKWYLDSGFGREDDALKKMRTSMLIGLFFIFEKSFWAREYIDQAIKLARYRGLNTMQKHSDYSEREWASWKRVWGSLVFLDGWLSGSLGSLPTIYEGNDPIYAEGYRMCINDLDACLHAELIKLGILMGHVTKEVYTPTIIDFDKVGLYSARLKSWHSSLPGPLRLSRAVSGNDPKQRSTILLAHCSYLYCIILLTRRIYVERLEVRVKGLDGLAQTALADEYTEMCISAAKQLAMVVGLLHEEGRIVRRCWMLIQSAYTAGLVVLLCMSTKSSDGSGTDPVNIQNQSLVCKCLRALEVSAAYDLVAQRFLDILSSILKSFMIPTNTQQKAGSKRVLDDAPPADESSRFPRFAVSSQLTRNILDIFRQPFGGESKVIGQDDYTLSRFFPQNWRFLAPEPSPETGFRSLGYEKPLGSSFSCSADGGDERDSRKRGTPPFRTKEEYEAFFRRIS